MARQTGIIRLKGTIGGISFYKSKDGHLAREKGGVDGKRIASDPAFQRTRENGSEFGRAGKGGKLLRNSIRILLQNAKDNRVVSRLTTALLAIAKTDTTNERGLRTIQDGNLGLIKDFEFNANGKLGSTLFAGFSTSYDRASGDISVDVPAFAPSVRIAAPAGTTHFKVVSGASELDFGAETSSFESDETAILPYDSADTAAIAMTMSASANSTLPVLIVLGIEFYQR